MCFGTLRLVGWVLFMTTASAAQSGTSTIAGLVKDATGASIPGSAGSRDQRGHRQRHRDDDERPRSVLRGPGLATMDLTLERTIALTARVRVEVRAEAYNLLNRANYNLPGFTLGGADFGVLSSARPPRIVQLGARLAC